MGFNCGVVGLPNVGKSTLFNGLTSSGAEAANYPFCTIEPNIGRVPVPDARLAVLAALASSERIVPTSLEFIDIAGLVKGASSGEGLGNKFLAQIREVDALAHVVRCFEDDEVSHTQGAIDPVSDVQVVQTELMLADLESLEKQRERLVKGKRGGDPTSAALLEVVQLMSEWLERGDSVGHPDLSDSEQELLRGLNLLSVKPVMYVANVEETAVLDGNLHSRSLGDFAKNNGAECINVSAQLDSEVAAMADPEERVEFLEALGLAESGLTRMVGAGYRLLELITFFTVGPNEARAWTVKKGTRAVEAAAKIHTDFARGFIKAEIISYVDFQSEGGETKAREAGRLRQEGRDYIVKDGDVILFRFNV
ncbi:MAG: redox-regulated ATPase YchF [Rhodospirillaceae bacterium]|nr:redox-regulated ATPase YchF [Rhodospirillaceae bacterium]